jgi:hypothetical protein
MSDEAPLPPQASAKTSSGCAKNVLLITLALIAAATALVFYYGESMKGVAGKVTEGFFTTEVKATAEEILLAIGRTHGDVLEVASPLTTIEIFHREDNRYAAWGWVYLGTTTSEIKVPATYRFHIKLSELHHARIEEGVLSITVKSIHPSLPVAFDTAAMEKKTDGTWLRFDASAQLAELERSLTPALEKRALEQLGNIREVARKDVEEFVQKWIVETHPERRLEVKAVKILFEGEESSAATKPALMP